MSWPVHREALQGIWSGLGEALESQASVWAARALSPKTLKAQEEARGLPLWAKWGLSPRLAEVAALCPQGVGVVDVGTDHALLPLALTRSAHTPAALGVDINEGPLRGARRRMRSDDRVTLTLANGFVGAQEPLSELWSSLGAPQEGLCGCVCGVGGAKVAEMIPSLPTEVKVLVLQPNLHHGRVRAALAEAGWSLTHERLTLDGGRLFLTLRASRSSVAPPSQVLSSGVWPEHSALLCADPLYPLWLWVHLERERALLSKAVEHTSPQAQAHFNTRRAWAQELSDLLSEALTHSLTSPLLPADLSC